MRTTPVRKIVLVLNVALLTGAAASRAASTEPAAAVGPGLSERIEMQRAVEQVLWSHRDWPETNPSPKPPLSSVLPESVLRARVIDALRNSNALESLWGRPITGAQLQAEVLRITRESRDPALLAELFAALGNDPARIAEVIARPILADRLLQNWYSRDRRFHLETETRARQALGSFDAIAAARGRAEAVDQMRELAGSYSEQEVEIEGSPSNALVPAYRPDLELGPLEENRDSFFVRMRLSSAPGSETISTVRWEKQPFDAWWAVESAKFSDAIASVAITGGTPAIAAASCVDDTWLSLNESVLDWRTGQTAVWTGAEMLVWGGNDLALKDYPVGLRYSPATDTWTAMSASGLAPTGRYKHSAVWTGTEMIVWGGASKFGPSSLDTGGRYDPLTDSWQATSTGAGLPEKRSGQKAVWTGTQMIIWGGERSSVPLGTGARYDPVSDTWTPTTTPKAPRGRIDHTAVWTGREMIVWGGSGTKSARGSRYNPALDRWDPVKSGEGAPAGRSRHTAVWTGREMIVWGGSTSPLYDNRGWLYDPAKDTWRRASIGPGVPIGRTGHSAVWSGSEMIVWGGRNGSELDTGARYDPLLNKWTPTSSAPGVPKARQAHSAVWTGNEMIVWGGDDISHPVTGGARYDPAQDSWLPVDEDAFEPQHRTGTQPVWTGTELFLWGGNVLSHPTDSGAIFTPATGTWRSFTRSSGTPAPMGVTAAVWTGTEMLVWGSAAANQPGVGGRYDPVTESWSSIAPGPLLVHKQKAVWTGVEMILWGGDDTFNVFFQTGARYDPGADAWSSTSLVGAPAARSNHSEVWTGTEMIVWGGEGPFGAGFGDGGRYDPSADQWVPVGSGPGAPISRSLHTAIWTGSEMIVWGGSTVPSQGGRYDPGTDTWTLVTKTGEPQSTRSHSAVWTGSEMIVWGGIGLSTAVNTGGRYDPAADSWRLTTQTSAPGPQAKHFAIWTGDEMLIYNGSVPGGRYCALPPP
jgi:N-acetylneuraminic acid mutarotase